MAPLKKNVKMIFIEQQINNTLTVWSPLNIFSKLISQVKAMGDYDWVLPQVIDILRLKIDFNH